MGPEPRAAPVPRAALALLLIAPVLAGCTSAPSGPQAPADVLVVHGHVWTNDPGVPSAQALAVRDGRIVLVGSDAGALALRGPATKVVDAQGGFVGPGFRDQHAHLLGVAAGTGEDGLVPGGGGNPYAPAMSQASPADTEAGRAQVAAFHVATRAAGKTPMDDWQADPATDCRAPSPVTAELKQRLRFAMEEAAKQGLTTVVEPGLRDLGVWDALREMERDGELRLRLLIRIAWGCLDEAAAKGLRTGVGSDWVRVLGVKLYSDGWLGPRTCALREPYSDRPLYNGILFLEPERAARDVAKARQLGFNVGTHAIGDRAMVTMLDAYEAAGVRPEDRWSLEHVQVLAPDILDRMASLGVVGSMQLSFATSDMGFSESALGAERIRWAYAWKSALERGVRLAGGTDFRIDVLNPLWGVQRTVTRQELDGRPPGGWHPEERLSLERTLQLITSDAAYASLEDDRGRLVPGAWADVVATREDLRALPSDQLAGATVVLTMANGVVTFEGAQAYPPRGTL